MQLSPTIFTFLLCLLLTTGSAYAQSGPEQLFQEGLCLTEAHRGSDKAIELLGRAAEKFEALGNWEKVAACFRQISLNHAKSRDYEAVIVFSTTALDKLGKQPFKKTVDVAAIYFDQAYAYGILEDYTHCLEAYKEAINIYQQQNYFDDWVALSYKNAALSCSRLLNYKLQLNYLQIPLQKGYTGKHAYSLYNSLASRYYYMGNYREAWKNYEKGLQYSKSAKDSALLKVLGAGIFSSLNRHDEALKLANYSIRYYEASN